MKRLVFPLLLAGAPILWALPPAWWSDPATKILDAANPATLEDNYAPANLGQLKNVAKQAKAHLDANLPGGAGNAINTLVTNFEPRTGQNYTAQQLADLRAANYASVNLGQLKAVAKPFYERLLSFSYDTKANLIAHGFPSLWSSNYPWNPATAVSENYAPANLGQLKAVFSFDLAAPPGQLPAWWQKYYFHGQVGIDPQGQSELTGLSYLQCYEQGLIPYSIPLAPLLNIAEVSYSVPLSISLSPSQGEQLYYTLDGSDPATSPSRSIAYGLTNIEFPGSGVLKAGGWKEFVGIGAASTANIVVTPDETNLNSLNRRPRYLLRPAR